VESAINLKANAARGALRDFPNAVMFQSSPANMAHIDQVLVHEDFARLNFDVLLDAAEKCV